MSPKKYRWKRDIVQKIVEKTDKLPVLRTNNLQTEPDLFVYKDNEGKKEYFFVEVKMPHDDLSEKQKEHFERIEKELNCTVILAKLIPKKFSHRRRHKQELPICIFLLLFPKSNYCCTICLFLGMFVSEKTTCLFC
jgi:hypothetical protein